MKKPIASLLVVIFTLLVLASSSLAGSRYYSKGYSSYYYGGYRSHYYHPYPRRHYYYSDPFLAHFGVGLLAGVVAGSILYQPPVQRTVIYSTPPPVVVHSRPVAIQPETEYYQDNEILRHVKPTVRLLNIRSGPGLDEEIIGQVAYGEVLGVIGAAPDWLYVKTRTGQYGWVMTQYTQALEGPVG